jgi:hypothetical protein
MQSLFKNAVFALILLNSASAFAKHSPKPAPTPTPTPTPSATPSPVESSQASDDESSAKGNSIFADLAKEDSNQTPYQLLESLYLVGKPAKISDFPSYEQCSTDQHFRPMKSLQSNVTQDLKKDDLKVQVGWIYVVNDLKWVISPAEPAKDDGPLFPVSPAVPEKDADFPYVLAVGATYDSIDQDFLGDPTAGACTNNPSDALKTNLVQENYTFIDTPDGASETITGTANGKPASEVTTFHMVDGVIVEKIVVTGTDTTGKAITKESYNYFWRAEATK